MKKHPKFWSKKRSILKLAENKEAAKIQYLLDRNQARINQRDIFGEVPLHKVARNGEESICAMLLKAGAFPDIFNKEGQLPLHVACDKGRTEVARQLIERSHFINAKDAKNKDTPLHICSQKGRADIVNYLIIAGVIHNIRNKSRETPILLAARNGHLKIVKRLLQLPQKINKPDKPKNTPLHEACANGHIHIVEALIQDNANINKKNKQGHTPLHIACEKGFFDIVMRLLKAGAEEDIKCKDRRKPFDLAFDNGFDKLINIIGRRESLDDYYDHLQSFLQFFSPVNYNKFLAIKDKAFHDKKIIKGASSNSIDYISQNYLPGQTLEKLKIFLEEPESVLVWNGKAESKDFYLHCKNQKRSFKCKKLAEIQAEE